MSRPHLSSLRYFLVTMLMRLTEGKPDDHLGWSRLRRSVQIARVAANVQVATASRLWKVYDFVQDYLYSVISSFERLALGSWTISSPILTHSHVLVVKTNCSDEGKLPLLLDRLESQVVLLELVGQAGGGGVELLRHIPARNENDMCFIFHFSCAERNPLCIFRDIVSKSRTSPSSMVVWNTLFFRSKVFCTRYPLQICPSQSSAEAGRQGTCWGRNCGWWRPWAGWQWWAGKVGMVPRKAAFL